MNGISNLPSALVNWKLGSKNI